MKPITHLAFLIGVQGYQHLQPLKTPLNDIRDLGQLLQSGYDYTVFDCQNPTLDALRAFFGKMKTEAVLAASQLPEGEPLSVLFYFAGHGIAADSETGVKGYLIPTDAQRTEAKTWLPMSELLDTLEALPCRHSLVLLDCCFSGSLRWASKHRAISGFTTSEEKLYKQHYEHFRSRRSSQVLTSAAPDQLALDIVRGGTATKRSPFAECVIRGLQGEADTVPDKVITCAELFAYLQNHLLAVSKKCGNPQNASLFPLDQHDFGEYLFFMDGFDPAALEVREYHNPYRGLCAYETRHQSEFFGRSQAIAALLSEVEQHPLMVVLGASGTGKSSLVKAGIVPRLKGRVSIIKPGLTPLAELPDAASYDLLVIDQLEQLVTQATEQDAKAFLEGMVGLLASGKKIIATLRIDYESRLPKIPELEGQWHRYLVPPFSAEELREVIVTPTFRQGHFIVPMTLVDRIIEEVIHYPGSLPLLSFTMRQLFERCKDQPFGNITPADYEALGGVIGALQRKADAVHDALPDDAHRNTMRCLMLRMVSLTGGQAAGKRVMVDDLHFTDPADNGRLQRVRTQLENEFLIMADTDHIGQGFVEPVHDALVTTWDKVQQWMKDFGDANLLLLNELEAAVKKHKREDRKESFLWHNSESLAQVLSLQNNAPSLLNIDENTFIGSSVFKKNKIQIKNRRKAAGVTTFIASLGILAIFFGIGQRRLKIQAEKKAYASQLASNAVRDYSLNPNIYLDSLIKAYSINKDESILDLLAQKIPYSIFYQKEIPIDNKQVLFADTDSLLGVLIVIYSDSVFQILKIKDEPEVVFEECDVTFAHFDAENSNVIHYISKSGKYNFDLLSKSISHSNYSFTSSRKLIKSVPFDMYGRELRIETIQDSTIALLKGHEDAINGMAISSNSTFVATCSDDYTVKLWNPTGNLLYTLKNSILDRVMNCFLSSNDMYLIAVHGFSTSKLFVWKLKGLPIASINYKPSRMDNFIDVYYADFLSKNEYVIVRCKNEYNTDAILLTHNHITKKEILLDSLEWWSYSDDPVAIGRKNEILAYPTRSNGFAIRDFSGNQIIKYHNEADTIEAVFISPDESFLVATNYFQKLYFFDFVGCKTREVSLNDSIYLNWHTLKFFPNGEEFVVGTHSGIAFFTKNGDFKRMVQIQDDVKTVDISSDGKFIICGGDDLILLDSLGGIISVVNKPHPTFTTKVRFCPNKKVFASLGVYGAVKLWDYEGRQLYDFKEMPVAWNITFHENNILISGRNEVKLWSLPNLPEDFVN